MLGVAWLAVASPHTGDLQRTALREPVPMLSTKEPGYRYGIRNAYTLELVEVRESIDGVETLVKTPKTRIELSQVLQLVETWRQDGERWVRRIEVRLALVEGEIAIAEQATGAWSCIPKLSRFAIDFGAESTFQRGRAATALVDLDPLDPIARLVRETRGEPTPAPRTLDLRLDRVFEDATIDGWLRAEPGNPNDDGETRSDRMGALETVLMPLGDLGYARSFDERPSAAWTFVVPGVASRWHTVIDGFWLVHREPRDSSVKLEARTHAEDPQAALAALRSLGLVRVEAPSALKANVTTSIAGKGIANADPLELRASYAIRADGTLSVELEGEVALGARAVAWRVDARFSARCEFQGGPNWPEPRAYGVDSAPPAPPSDLRIEVERTGGRGNLPQCTTKLDAAGHVAFHGKRHTVESGERSFDVEHSRVVDAWNAVRESRVLVTPLDCDCRNRVRDAAGLELRITVNGATTTIDNRWARMRPENEPLDEHRELHRVIDRLAEALERAADTRFLIAPR